MGGLPSPIFLAGPTAVGKSEVASLLAEQYGGEIITVDSMQVYRGLDIGTAKPSASERSRVPHHLLDVAELREPFDAGKFCLLARKAVTEIEARGRAAIFCGGTGLYFKAYLEGLGESPPSDPQLRAALEAAPLDDLLRELSERDPQTFARIDRQNPRRVVRAVEVIRLTGRPFSEQRTGWNDAPDTSHLAPFFILTRPKTELDQRINVRVDGMFRSGLVEETRELLAHGLAENPTAMQAIGYRQVVEHLRGERSLAETVEMVKARTRQYAKRQMTWFRGHTAATWMELAANETAAETCRRIVQPGK